MRGGLSRDGLHFSTDLVFLGLNPINGWFKNVSLEPLAPASLIMESFILGDWNAVQNRPMLNVLGINLVVTRMGDEPLPGGLGIVERYPVRPPGRGEFLIFANPDAWPLAVLMEADAHAARLPVRQGCRHTAALCAEYEALHQKRLPDTVTLVVEPGRYVARLPPANRERLLFLSVLYRPDWQAVSPSGPLQTHAVAGAFLSVSIPAGVGEVTLQYTPRVFRALTWLSNLTFIGLVGICCLLWRRQPQSATEDSPHERR